METQEWEEFQQMTPEQVKTVSAKHLRKPKKAKKKRAKGSKLTGFLLLRGCPTL